MGLCALESPISRIRANITNATQSKDLSSPLLAKLASNASKLNDFEGDLKAPAANFVTDASVASLDIASEDSVSKTDATPVLNQILFKHETERNLEKISDKPKHLIQPTQEPKTSLPSCERYLSNNKFTKRGMAAILADTADLTCWQAQTLRLICDALVSANDQIDDANTLNISANYHNIICGLLADLAHCAQVLLTAPTPLQEEMHHVMSPELINKSEGSNSDDSEHYEVDDDDEDENFDAFRHDLHPRLEWEDGMLFY